MQTRRAPALRLPIRTKVQLLLESWRGLVRRGVANRPPTAPRAVEEGTHVRQLTIQDLIRREMRMGRAALNDGLIRDLPKTHAELTAAMEGVDRFHQRAARNYSALRYGERFMGLNDWFLKERVGLNDVALRGNMANPPSAVRGKRLPAIGESDPRHAEIKGLMTEIRADEHLLPEDRAHISSHLDFLRGDLDVKKRWEIIKNVRGHTADVEEFLTHPEVRESAEEMAGRIRELRGVKSGFDAIAGTLPRGDFGPEHRARLYPVLHPAYPAYLDYVPRK